MTQEWYKLVQKVTTRFRIIANLRIATLTKISIKDIPNLASNYSHFVCNVSFFADFSKCGYQIVMYSPPFCPKICGD